MNFEKYNSTKEIYDLIDIEIENIFSYCYSINKNNNLTDIEINNILDSCFNQIHLLQSIREKINNKLLEYIKEA